MTLNSLLLNNQKSKPTSGDMVVELNENNEILSCKFRLNLDITEAQLKTYVDTVLNDSKDSGKIKIQGYSFVFAKKDFVNGSKIAFLNISYEESFKLKLLQIFSIIGGASLVLLLIISIVLTNKSIKPIKDSFEKQKQFVADASHELKTPLAIIKTNTSLILSNPEDQVKNQAKWVKYIEDQSDRMSNLVNEMLSLAKLDRKSVV